MACSAASFEVNSEPLTGARPSVGLCVGPELARCVHLTITSWLAELVARALQYTLAPEGFGCAKSPVRNSEVLSRSSGSKGRGVATAAL